MIPRRIVVLGCAGTGKSSFSKKLADHLGVPNLCLDEIWRPGWGAEEVPAFRELIGQAHAGETWVSDGNFAAATFDMRLPRAELVLWLERPRWLCALNAIRRLTEPGQSHTWRRLPDVLGFIRRFDRVNRPRIEMALAEHGSGVPLWRLRSRADEAALFADRLV